MTGEPVRENPLRQCRCLLIYNVNGRTATERCYAQVPVDQPFCHCCEDRHATDFVVVTGISKVSAVPLPLTGR